MRILHQTPRVRERVGYAHVANKILKIEQIAIKEALINQKMPQNV